MDMTHRVLDVNQAKICLRQYFQERGMRVDLSSLNADLKMTASVIVQSYNQAKLILESWLKCPPIFARKSIPTLEKDFEILFSFPHCLIPSDYHLVQKAYFYFTTFRDRLYSKNVLTISDFKNCASYILDIIQSIKLNFSSKEIIDNFESLSSLSFVDHPRLGGKKPYIIEAPIVVSVSAVDKDDGFVFSNAIDNLKFSRANGKIFMSKAVFCSFNVKKVELVFDEEDELEFSNREMNSLSHIDKANIICNSLCRRRIGILPIHRFSIKTGDFYSVMVVDESLTRDIHEVCKHVEDFAIYIK